MRRVFLGSLVAVVGLALAIVLLSTDGVLLWGLGLFLGVGGILVLLLVVLLFVARIPILGGLTGWLLEHVPPKVWVLVALLLFGLAISAGERAHLWAVRTFTNYVQIEAQWQHPKAMSPAYMATVHNHMGRTMSFHCTVDATLRGEDVAYPEVTDSFTVRSLPDDASRTVAREMEVESNTANPLVRVSPVLTAECAST